MRRDDLKLEKGTVRTLALVLFGAILFYWALDHWDLLWDAVRLCARLMFPFFLGFCIAFVLNVPMRALEKKFWPQTDKKALNALRRPTCILVSLVLILAILTAVVMLVVPELVNAFGVLADQVPVFLKNAQAWLLANGDAFPALQDWLSSAQIDWNSIGKTLFGYVTTGAGNPGKYMEVWKAAGIKVFPVVASVALAKRMERAGADGVVAEGCESGGHIGSITTMCLVPQVVDAVSIPVLAAGGIADGRGLAAAMMLGAEGIQMGTVFLASDECRIHPTYKELVLGAKDTDTAITGEICGGAPCRQIKTRYTRRVNERERAGATFAEIEELTVGSLRRAVQDGDRENGSFMCGQIAGLVKEARPCQRILEDIFSQGEEIMKNRLSLLK